MKRILSLFGYALAILLAAGAADAQNTSNYREQGGARTVIGGSLDVVSGGDLDMESGSALKIAGTTVSGTAVELDEAHVVFRLQNIGGANSGYVVAPATGTVSKFYSVIDGAGGEGETKLELLLNAVSAGDITIGSGAGAGEIDSAAPSTIAVTAGDLIQITSDGGAANNVDAVITVIIDR